MGPYRSGWFSNLLVWLTFLGMGAAAVAMFATLGSSHCLRTTILEAERCNACLKQTSG